MCFELGCFGNFRKSKGSKKRSRIDHEKESVKKQKLEEEDAEKEELRACLDIVLVDDIAIDVESLATKYPIVDWKTHTLTEHMMYYQIIRANGNSKNYKILTEMCDDFDRQDIIDLYRLVKKRIIDYLHQEFSMTDLGSLNYFLGIYVTRDSLRMFLSQRKYATKILEWAHMVGGNSNQNPVDAESKLRDDGDPVSDPTLYRSLTVLFSILLLLALIFLMQAPDYGLKLFSSSTTSLVAYSDADWAGYPTTRGSTSEAEYRDVANVVAKTLANPSTRQFRILPKPLPRYVPIVHGEYNLIGPIGFGYDSFSDDYKVVLGSREGSSCWVVRSARLYGVIMIIIRGRSLRIMGVRGSAPGSRVQRAATPGRVQGAESLAGIDFFLV
nr:hypothetical protein [Tanacetum cinerariifolium]